MTSRLNLKTLLIASTLFVLTSCLEKAAEEDLSSLASDTSYYIAYNSDGYQKLFKSDGLTVKQISNVNPTGHDNINQIAVLKNAPVYKLYFSACYNYCSLYASDENTTTIIDSSFSGQFISGQTSLIYLNNQSKKIIQINSSDLSASDAYTSSTYLNLITWQPLLNKRSYFYESGSNKPLMYFDGLTDQLSSVTGYPTNFDNYTTVFDYGTNKLLHVVTNRDNNQIEPYIVDGNIATLGLDSGETFSQTLGYSGYNTGAVYFVVNQNGLKNLKLAGNNGVQTILDNKTNIYVYTYLNDSIKVESTDQTGTQCYLVNKNGAELLGQSSCSNY